VANIFVISDTHFNHANILNFTNDAGELVRPGFESVEAMNEHIIEKWNSVVGPNDHVYHLGDVHFGAKLRAKENAAILRRLNGKKRLVLGNHDDGKDPLLHEFFEKIMLWRMFKEFGVVLSHTPMHPAVLGEARWDGSAINIHGHIHRNVSPSPKHINVSVEAIDYTPKLIPDLLREHRL
jgi:calcineurin-like phosphoesterase family protein